jgi:hypothetical protein
VRFFIYEREISKDLRFLAKPKSLKFQVNFRNGLPRLPINSPCAELMFSIPSLIVNVYFAFRFGQLGLFHPNLKIILVNFFEGCNVIFYMFSMSAGSGQFLD